MGDAQVLIAINDDGVDLNHPDFAGKLAPELNYPVDWETQMNQGTFGGHGTSVAGVAGALADNTEGGAGVCPNCRLLPHLMGESAGWGFQVTDAEVAQGFTNIVDAGAWIINNSWGLETGDPIYQTQPVSLPPLAAVSRSRSMTFLRPTSTSAKFPARSASMPAPAKPRGSVSSRARASSTVAARSITAAQTSCGFMAFAGSGFCFFSRASVQVKARPVSLRPRVGAPLTESE